MASLLIIGAGAIGRGYLPWMFTPGRYDFVFVDRDPAIIARMRAAGGYSTWRVRNDRLEQRVVPVRAACMPEEFSLLAYPDIAAVFINVGPRHAARAAAILGSSSLPVILCENDPAAVAAVQAACPLERVYFAVPDVITSNTAPAALLAQDPLAIVSEDGALFLDNAVTAADLDGELQRLPRTELINTQWTAKLYLHNTPHCVAAYLGALLGVRFVHEAMHHPEADRIVQGAMDEMLRALKLSWDIPHRFLDWYAAKEMQRFRCRHLHDPITRVAREPLRKLEPGGRLMGAAQMCLSMGFVPNNLLTGIASAMLFENRDDADYHLSFMRRALPLDGYLTHVLNLRAGESLEIVLRERLDGIMARLAALRGQGRQDGQGGDPDGDPGEGRAYG